MTMKSGSWVWLTVVLAATAAADNQVTPAENAKIQAALSRSQDDVEISQLSDGTRKIDLQGHFQHASMIRINKDGQIETYCSEHADEAERFLQGEHVRPVTRTPRVKP